MNDEALIGDVRNWLLRHGYVLEMEVARAVAAHATWTFQGSHYTDALTGKVRETDVMGIWAEPPNAAKSAHSVTLVAECKSTSAPWVLFTGESEPGGLLPLAGSEHGCVTCGDLVESVGQLVTAWGPLAYAIAEKRDTNKGVDHAYEAVHQALAATLSGLGAGPDARGHSETTFSTIGLPTVVTKSPLVLCSLAEGADVDLRVTDRAVIEVASADTAEGPDTYPVLVVNHAALPDLMTAISTAANFDRPSGPLGARTDRPTRAPEAP